MARCTMLLTIAYAGSVMVAVHAAAESFEPTCVTTGACSQPEDLEASVLLQSATARAATVRDYECSKRSLVISREVDEDTYLQWNLELVANGADFNEFVNLTRSAEGLRFETDVEFVMHGHPVFGIIYIQLPDIVEDRRQSLTLPDALKLKCYLEAGGMLVVGERNEDQVNQLLMDLGSSIKVRERSPYDDKIPCSTPEDAPYLPKTQAGVSWCTFTRGVTGLQGSNLGEVIDPEDSSYPLFHLAGNEDYVVARIEKTRNLVVVGADDPFDDECATTDEDNRLAFGRTTNLRFFAHLWRNRCRDER